MKRVPALACLLALHAPLAWAQLADGPRHPAPAAAHEHAVPQGEGPPSPTPPPPTAEERAHAFPDLGGMDMRAHMDDDPFVATLQVDRLEAYDDHGADTQAWEVHGWAGHRRNRLEWRSRGERSDDRLRDRELELLWSRAVDPWWNRTLGVRHDSGADGKRDWLALGVEGVAPYKIDVAASVYAGESGLGARIEGSYDLLLTQRLVLQPRMEADAYFGNDAPRDSLEAGLRLRYEFSRRFAPYVGYAWSTRSDDGAGGRWVAGIRAWF